MNYSVDHVNSYVKERDFSELVAFAEARHTLQFEMLFNEIHIADKDAVGPYTDIIMVTGPSSSGKTTFSNMLAASLANDGYNASVISLDNYYRNTAQYRKSLEKKGKVFAPGEDPDFECLEAFDVAFFKKQMKAYLNNEEFVVPEFDFTTGRRKKGKRRIVPTDKDIIIVEGIQALNPELIKGIGFHRIFRVYICPFDAYAADGYSGTINPKGVRLMRRAIRDKATRNASLSKTLSMWPSVRNGEEKYIKPMKYYADFFFNSSFEYEICFLKDRIMPLYDELDVCDKKKFEEYVDMVLLGKIETKTDFTIPENSIFNEFFI